MKPILFLIIAILATGYLIFQPSPDIKAQQKDTPKDTSKTPIEILINRGENLTKKDGEKKEELAAAVSEAVTPKPETIIKYKTKLVPVKVIKEVLASDQKVLLRLTNSDGTILLEVDKTALELYKGHLIVDINIDSLKSSIQPQSTFIPTPSADINRSQVTPAFNQSKPLNWWQKFKAKF